MSQPLTCLIKSLNVNSPKDRYNALLEWLVTNPDLFCKEDTQSLIDCFKKTRDEKVSQGKRDSGKRWNKVKQPDQWIFIEHSSYKGVCEKCRESYFIDDSIWVKNRKGYHIDCAPAEAIESNNQFYQAYLNKKENTP